MKSAGSSVEVALLPHCGPDDISTGTGYIEELKSKEYNYFEQNNTKTRGAFLAIANPYLENIRANFYEILGKEKFNTEDVNFIESEFNDLMLENGFKNLFNFQKFKVFLKSARDEKN